MRNFGYALPFWPLLSIHQANPFYLSEQPTKMVYIPPYQWKIPVPLA